VQPAAVTKILCATSWTFLLSDCYFQFPFIQIPFTHIHLSMFLYIYTSLLARENSSLFTVETPSLITFITAKSGHLPHKEGHGRAIEYQE
jgi:hypothetical protein